MRNFTELYRRDLPHRAISVYRYLADCANKDGIPLAKLQMESALIELLNRLRFDTVPM